MCSAVPVPRALAFEDETATTLYLSSRARSTTNNRSEGGCCRDCDGHCVATLSATAGLVSLGASLTEEGAGAGVI